MAKPGGTEAMTKLLQEHEVGISAVKANKLLLQREILIECERESSTRPGVMKKYKVLSEEGLNYGVNYENPQSPDQTSPYYYTEKFPQLVEILLQEAAKD